MKLYLITGASGLVGTNLLNKLLEEKNVKIVALINKTPLHIKNDKIEQVRCNICNKKAIDKIFSTYNFEENICIHCAGVITIKKKNSSNINNVNITGTQNIVDACLNYNYKLVYVSSVDSMEKAPFGTPTTETTNFSLDNLKGDYSKTKARSN